MMAKPDIVPVFTDTEVNTLFKDQGRSSYSSFTLVSGTVVNDLDSLSQVFSDLLVVAVGDGDAAASGVPVGDYYADSNSHGNIRKRVT